MTDTMEIETDAQKLGRFFRHYREAAGLTLHDMSKALNLSINPIRAHEGGHRLLRLPDLWSAAKILGVTHDKLLDPDSEPEITACKPTSSRRASPAKRTRKRAAPRRRKFVRT